MRVFPDFQCKLCDRAVDMRWARPGRDTPIPPFCSYCEFEFSKGHGKPSGGSLRDRREVMRGFAVAEFLHCEAGRMAWESKNAA